MCNDCIKIKCRTCGKEYPKSKAGVHEGFQCKECEEKERLERLRRNAVAEFTFEDAQLFEKLLKAIGAVEDEALMQITNDGVLVRVMDPSRVAMLDYFIGKRDFQEYRVHKEGFLYFSVEELLKHMKHLRKDTLIRGFVDGKDGKFTITLVDTRERQRQLPTLEVDKGDVLPIPKINFTTKVKMVASDFCTDLDDLETASDHVSFEADWDTFLVKAHGDYVKAKNEYKKGQPILLETEGDGNNKSVYSLNYLKALIRKDLSEIITFEWSKDMPMKISHKSEDLKHSQIVAYLAPRVEVDD